jgi:hypothetical protein
MSDNEKDYEINVFDQYSDYTKIEMHLELSRMMFMIDKKGRHILSELEGKKFERKKRSGTCVFNDEVGKLYSTLVSVLNVRRFSPRLYCVLQHYMDELLFKEVTSCDKFFVEEEEYDLTRLYYDQSSWVKNQDIQAYKMDLCSILDTGEAMCLVCFLREYEDFLFTIEEYIKDINHTQLKNILLKILRRFRIKLKIVWDIVLKVITLAFREKN